MRDLFSLVPVLFVSACGGSAPEPQHADLCQLVEQLPASDAKAAAVTLCATAKTVDQYRAAACGVVVMLRSRGVDSYELQKAEGLCASSDASLEQIGEALRSCIEQL